MVKWISNVDMWLDGKRRVKGGIDAIYKQNYNVAIK